MKTLTEVLQDWEAVIGLEIHTELTTLETKMFCDCKLSHSDAPNTHVCPVCLGLPGALPVPNQQAIEAIVMAGLACNCDIQRRSQFYRKHYFYPDMAKNYQITQGSVAICMHGHLDLEIPTDAAAERSLDARAYVLPVHIQRIHMEEDAAKMIHVGGEEGRISSASESLIDYNRCGTPLIELVTEPDLRTPAEARLFMEKLRQIFLTLGISDCSLESGSMRCDGNVSLRRRGSSELGVKCEMKNLNSFKALHDALAYEICRQAEQLEQGLPVVQETRHWEPSQHCTVTMRVKETNDDYCFFPDPDLAPLDLSDEFIEHCRLRIPELPDTKIARYCASWGLRHREANMLAADPIWTHFFEQAAQGQSPQTVQQLAKVLLNDVAGWFKATGHSLDDGSLTPEQLVELCHLLDSHQLASNHISALLDLLVQQDGQLEELLDQAGLRQISDTAALQKIVAAVLARSSDQQRQYQMGNTKVLGYLVGQCMKESHGSGNPKLFKDLLVRALGTFETPVGASSAE